MRYLASSLLALSSIVFPTSAKLYPTRFDNVTWDDGNWTITTTNLDQGHYQSRMSLANGYFGINLAAVGPFFEVDTPVNGDQISGWPLFNRRQAFATIGGFYDSQPTTNGTNFEWLNQYGGESPIAGVPHWSGLVVEVAGQVLNASVPATQISNFSSTMDFRRGVLDWKYTWSPGGGVNISVEYEMFVHKLYVNQAAIQLKLTSSKDVNLTVTDVHDGDCAVRTEFVDKKFETKIPSIWSAVRPSGIQNVTAYVYSTLKADQYFGYYSRKQVTENIGLNQSSIAQAVSGKLKAGKTTTIQKFVGAASTDAFSNPQATAQNASLSAASCGYQSLLASHVSEWKTILPKDSVDSYHLTNGSLPEDENILELQILAVTNPYQLVQNTIGLNAVVAAGNNSKLNVNSISVCGLASDCYAGYVFWDADVWMAPGLAVSHPEASSQLANYRVAKFGQAKENIKMAFSSSQNETGKFSEGGAVYPWTSGRFGNCTGTGPCFDYEYHLNGDIGIEVYNQFVVSGDVQVFKQKLFPIYNAIAWFFAELLSFNETSGLYVLTNATDPVS